MSKEYETIDDKLATWIKRQKLFFVSTAPLSKDGSVNCSPKGFDTLRILGPKQLAYLDLPGSGVETVSHLRENQRLTIMMCAFEGPPKIFRFFGTGEVITPDHKEFDELSKLYETDLPYRAVIRLNITRILDSCGYGVPFYSYKEPRKSMHSVISKADPDALNTQFKSLNSKSIDGLPGLDNAELQFPKSKHYKSKP